MINLPLGGQFINWVYVKRNPWCDRVDAKVDIFHCCFMLTSVLQRTWVFHFPDLWSSLFAQYAGEVQCEEHNATVTVLVIPRGLNVLFYFIHFYFNRVSPFSQRLLSRGYSCR